MELFNSQNDFNDTLSSEKKIKTLAVIAKKTVQKVGDLEITAPVGVGIDQTTGNLTAPVRLEILGEPVLKPRIIKNHLINEGFVPAKLIVEDNDPEPCTDIRKGFVQRVFIPFQSVLEFEGIKPGDDIQEKIKVKSTSVMGFPDVRPPGLAGTKVKLILKVILKVKIIISRECIIAVPIHICSAVK